LVVEWFFVFVFVDDYDVVVVCFDCVEIVCYYYVVVVVNDVGLSCFDQIVVVGFD
jgi:hypothetical protein